MEMADLFVSAFRSFDFDLLFESFSIISFHVLVTVFIRALVTFVFDVGILVGIVFLGGFVRGSGLLVCFGR